MAHMRSYCNYNRRSFPSRPLSPPYANCGLNRCFDTKALAEEAICVDWIEKSFYIVYGFLLFIILQILQQKVVQISIMCCRDIEVDNFGNYSRHEHTRALLRTFLFLYYICIRCSLLAHTFGLNGFSMSHCVYVFVATLPAQASHSQFCTRTINTFAVRF